MIVVLAFLLSAVPAGAATAAYGIILLAHGGDASWNREIEILRARVDAKVPTVTALGMADPSSLQAAVDRLEKRGVSRIVAVPLFVQSRSEILDQTRYALGLSEAPSESLRKAYARIGGEHAAHAGHAGRVAEGHGHSMEFSTRRVKSALPIVMTSAFDDSPLIGDILLERAQALSKNASRETVLLVGHGPVDDGAVASWLDSMASLCGAVAGGGFRACAFGLLRDDAAPEVRAAAVADLREKVARAKTQKGRAIVVPVLIARGGIEKKIAADLAGLDYAWEGKTLMPHAGFDAWVLDRAATADGSAQP